MTGPAVDWTRHCPGCGGSGRGTWEYVDGIYTLTAVEHGVQREGQAVVCQRRAILARRETGTRPSFDTGKRTWVRTVGPAMEAPAR